MNEEPYFTEIYCPKRDVEDVVFFYEVNINGTWYLEFKGCEHDWNKCPECEQCKKEAYPKIIKKYR